MRETIGGYRILNEIGSGGFGAVYRAYDSLSGRAVALKTLNPKFAVSSSIIERFRREALLTSEMNHPNIIRILGGGEDGGAHFIAMEMMPLSLSDALFDGRLPISRAMDICRQAALGLKAAHDRGVIHRDIKPANILIAPNGTVKVSDFGIAHADSLPDLTATGATIGTGRYMSPERFMDSKRVDARADIYSLGVTICEMLTGKRHKRGESVKASRPAIPGELERIVNKCVEIDRENRCESMGDLLQEIANPALINRCVLIDFYEAVGGPNWKRSDNWLTDAPLSKWYGLNGNKEIYDEYYGQNSCESYDRYEERYYARRESLLGPLWRRPAAGDDVRKLDLEFNNLKGRTPPEIRYLTGLELGLDNNPGIAGRVD